MIEDLIKHLILGFVMYFIFVFGLKFLASFGSSKEHWQEGKLISCEIRIINTDEDNE
ncbi:MULTISPECIES: hypothetical protein [unclassified Gilliamella]|uniref:hypothetical protein n=1 Tax=unclassified Gilliamella TaxID=2685620 RepID=UPI00226A6148|nr:MULTISPECIES: hypothetical protein [unclassified Gilliamella]MCX8589126.1 hypothetical protein [Gilliamella sp. B3801]MCX8592603.1 hypothetical protein [Gilliamella sp. B3804]